MKNKLRLTRGKGEGINGRKKGKGHQGTYIKEPWTKTMGSLNMGGGRV